MWTNKEKIENYRVSGNEIEGDENCTPSGINKSRTWSIVAGIVVVGVSDSHLLVE